MRRCAAIRGTLMAIALASGAILPDPARAHEGPHGPGPGPVARSGEAPSSGIGKQPRGRGARRPGDGAARLADLPVRAGQAVELASRLIQIPSLSGSEGPVAAYLESYARARGFHVERLDHPDGRPNVLISLRPLPATGTHVLFLHHLDVVTVEGQGWSRDPFSGEVIDGELWGRGAIDNKGSLAVAFAAMEAYRDRHGPDAPIQVSLLAVAGEETDGGGADHVAAAHIGRLRPTLIIGEGGTGVLGLVEGHAGVPVFGIATSEKSSLWLRLEIRVPGSGHGSVPRDETAVTALIRALQRLERKPFEPRFTRDTLAMLHGLARLERWPRNLFLRNPGWPIVARVVRRFLSANPVTAAMIRDTANITVLGTDPGPPNVIPRGAWAQVDCRLLPGTGEDRFLEELRERLDEPRITLEVLRRRPNVLGTPDSPYLEQLASVLESAFPGSVAVPIVFPATSDSNTFRLHGVPVLGMCPVVLEPKYLEAIHGADERLPVAAVAPAVAALTAYLESFDQGSRRGSPARDRRGAEPGSRRPAPHPR